MFWTIVKAVGALPKIFEMVQNFYQKFLDLCQADYLDKKQKSIEKAVDKATKTKDTKDLEDQFK